MSLCHAFREAKGRKRECGRLRLVDLFLPLLKNILVEKRCEQKRSRRKKNVMIAANGFIVCKISQTYKDLTHS
jgi:hypothetical protein